MARTGSLIRRALNTIFRVAPELDTPKDIDSDLEARGYLKVQNGVMSPYDTSEGKNAYLWYVEQMKIEIDRRKRYDIYDEMDRESPELSSALDIYADNATQADFDGKQDVVRIDSSNTKVKKILDDFIKEVGINGAVWSIARNLAKYGEDFEELVIDKNLVPRRLKNLDGKYMIRNEDEFGRLKEDAFLQVDEQDPNKIIAAFKKWQIIHFRIQKDRKSKYGSGVLEPAIRVYRQLSFMEDSMVIARLTRAPQRYAHLVDVNGMTPEEAEKHIDKVRNKLKKRRTINPRTGKQDLNYNPLSAEEDLFVGVRDGSRADVKVLQGDTNLSNIKDVYYFQNKLFSATKVPKSYLGLEQDVNSKGTVTEQEIQFARTVRRIQNAIATGLKEMFDFVLALNGIAPSNVEYRIILPTISMIDELRKWQSRLVKMQVAQLYQQVFGVNSEYLMRTFLNMTDEEIQDVLANQDEMQKLKIDLMRAQLQNAKNPSVNTTGGAGNKPPLKNPTDTKHNQQNSMNRKTQRTANTRPASQQAMTKKQEALYRLMTEEIEDIDELLELIAVLKGVEDDFEFELQGID